MSKLPLTPNKVLFFVLLFCDYHLVTIRIFHPITHFGTTASTEKERQTFSDKLLPVCGDRSDKSPTIIERSWLLVCFCAAYCRFGRFIRPYLCHLAPSVDRRFPHPQLCARFRFYNLHRDATQQNSTISISCIVLRVEQKHTKTAHVYGNDRRRFASGK